MLFIWVFKPPICTFFKISFLHFYIWAECWTSENLRWQVRLQVCHCHADTRVRFPMSKAFFKVFKLPICIISKVSYLYFYTGVDFWTFDYLIELLRLQACNHHVDTRVRFSTSRAFFTVFKRPIYTISKVSYSYFYTWVDFWTFDYLMELLRLQACNRQVDSRVRFSIPIAFFRGFKCHIFTFFSLLFILLHLGGFLNLSLFHRTTETTGMLSPGGYLG